MPYVFLKQEIYLLVLNVTFKDFVRLLSILYVKE